MSDAAPATTPKRRAATSTAEVAAGGSLPAKRGGAREGAGRKSKAIEEGSAEAHILYSKARAKKMAFDAQMTELEFNIKSGEFLPRTKIREGSATALSVIAQSMRSIPDYLERKLGLAPEVTEEIAMLIDEAMGNLADELERLHRGGN